MEKFEIPVEGNYLLVTSLKHGTEWYRINLLHVVDQSYSRLPYSNILVNFVEFRRQHPNSTFHTCQSRYDKNSSIRIYDTHSSETYHATVV